MTSNKVNLNKRKTINFFLKGFFLLIMCTTFNQKKINSKKSRLSWVLQGDDL